MHRAGCRFSSVFEHLKLVRFSDLKLVSTSGATNFFELEKNNCKMMDVVIAIDDVQASCRGG